MRLRREYQWPQSRRSASPTEKKEKQNPERGIGNGHPELCEDNEVAVSDCKSRQSVSVQLVN